MGKSSEALTSEICREYIRQHLFEPKDTLRQTDGCPGLIGVELEAFPVRFSDVEKLKAVTVPLNAGNPPLYRLLEQQSAYAGGKMAAEGDETISEIRFPNGSSFQYEPGGQIETVTHPCQSLSELVSQLRFQQEILDRITQKNQIHFAQCGLNPWFNSHQIGLQLDLPRYRALQNYFSQIGSFGIQMMRQTCSLHVNLDLGQQDQTQTYRILATNLLAPFSTAIFANSGISAGRQCGRKSQRSFIWQQLDPKRTGIWLTQFSSAFPDKEVLIDAYTDFAFAAPIIYIQKFGDRVFPQRNTFSSWLQKPIEGVSPTLDDLKNHLSLLYPEVRPKGILEIRTADALPREWQTIPAFFYTGLLYSDRHLEKTMELLWPFSDSIDSIWRKASFGLASREILECSQALMKLAMDGLDHLPIKFVGEKNRQSLFAFYEEFTALGKSPSDLMISAFTKYNSLFN